MRGSYRITGEATTIYNSYKKSFGDMELYTEQDVYTQIWAELHKQGIIEAEELNEQDTDTISWFKRIIQYKLI